MPVVRTLEVEVIVKLSVPWPDDEFAPQAAKRAVALVEVLGQHPEVYDLFVVSAKPGASKDRNL